MKFCPVVPEICRGQVHGARKERRITRTRRRIIIIIIRNGAKTISLQMLFGRLNYIIVTIHVLCKLLITYKLCHKLIINNSILTRIYQ